MGGSGRWLALYAYLQCYVMADRGATFEVTAAQELPYFDETIPHDVTASVGHLATLRCRVKHKGNRTVSWIRKRDLHIIASDVATYSGDARYSVKQAQDGRDWSAWDLRIRNVKPEDIGVYDCQLNTEPKVNFPVLLNVEAARARIVGAADVFVRHGSTISLTCAVNVLSRRVQWFRGSTVVDFESPRGGISLDTDRTDSVTRSRLMVTRASPTDSGNYTCAPSGESVIPASVIVHVLDDEEPAAMHTSNGGRKQHNDVIKIIICEFIFVNILNFGKMVKFLFAYTDIR